MNQTMSFPELARTAAVITNVMAGRGAVALCTADGARAYIPERVFAESGAAQGGTVRLLVKPNSVRAEVTPWFAVACEQVSDCPLSTDNVLGLLLEQGGSWTAEEVAGEFVKGQPAMQDIAHATAVLEQLYRLDARVAKVCLFQSSHRDARQVWYTATPEDCDYAAFEEA